MIEYTANRVDNGEEVKMHLLSAYEIDPTTLKPVLSDKIKLMIEEARECLNDIMRHNDHEDAQAGGQNMYIAYEQILKELGIEI